LGGAVQRRGSGASERCKPVHPQTLLCSALLSLCVVLVVFYLPASLSICLSGCLRIFSAALLLLVEG
jgi:hypothetical protein